MNNFEGNDIFFKICFLVFHKFEFLAQKYAHTVRLSCEKGFNFFIFLAKPKHFNNLLEFRLELILGTLLLKENFHMFFRCLSISVKKHLDHSGKVLDCFVGVLFKVLYHCLEVKIPSLLLTRDQLVGSLLLLEFC